ncbi:MAG TPA: YciI family protein [Ktedonobacterales bacterium]|nr:YciI family protein [Ktedonobacterales bacterium]
MTESVQPPDGEQWIFEVPPDMVVRYVRLLRRGPNWTAEQTPEMERLQAAHLAYGRQLIAEGKLILNGPMLDGGDLRGFSVFRVGSLAEALALAEADLAVQAGRLIAEVHPWMIFKGVLPE